MIGPLSNLPIGLLDLVGVRGSPQYPNSLAETIVPMLDISRYIEAYSAELLSETIAVAVVGLGSFLTLQVPQNEAWLVMEHTVTAVTGAAELLRMRAVTSTPTSGAAHVVSGEEAASSMTDAAAASSILATLRGPFVINGPTVPGVWVERITTAGSINITGRLRFVRLRR